MADSNFLGPLTTTFTPPADCDLLTVWINPQVEGSTTRTTYTNLFQYDISWPAGGRCFPSGRPTGSFQGDDFYYSPGLCPKGWTSYQSGMRSNDGIETVAMCCPSGFTRTSDFDIVGSSEFTACNSKILAVATVTAVVVSGPNPDVIPGNPIGTIVPSTVTDFVLTTGVGKGAPPFYIRYRAGDFAIPSSTSSHSTIPTSSSSLSKNPTSTSSQFPAPTPAPNLNVGLSNGARIGLGVGIPMAIIILAAIVTTIWIRRCRQKRSHQRDSIIELAKNRGRKTDSTEAKVDANLISCKKNEPEQQESATTQQKMDEVKLFEYERLEFPSRTIRLIELEKGHPGDELRCHLGVFRFREDDFGSNSPVLKYKPAPPFEALSYRWGDDTMNHLIYLQGCRKYVTASLDDILRALRQPQTSRWIWIDQLCINQLEETPYEKPPQILLMTKIYTRASSVPIWIGRAKESSTETAISAIEAACRQKPSVNSIRFGMYKDSPPGADRDSRKAVADGFSEATLMSFYLGNLQDFSMLPGAGSKERNAMLEFFNQEWFFRCWTFQEVVLSRTATIYCGNHKVSWENAAWVAALLEHVPDAFYKGDERAGVHAANITWFYQLGYLSAKTTPPLIELLATISGHNKATDPSDKIFGYLGIARETASKEISEINRALRPRYADLPPYKIPFEEKLKLWESWAIKVYTDLAFYYIDTTKNLAILSHVHHTASSALAPNCPSWVPRWNRERPRYMIWQYHDTPQTGFRAHGKMKLVDYSVRERAGHMTLDLRGHELYTVGKVSGILSDVDMKTPATAEQESSPDYRWIRKLIQLAECYPTEKEKLRKESLVLTAGRRGFGHDPMGNGIEEKSSETEHVNDYASLVTILCRQELADPTRVEGKEKPEETINKLALKAAGGNGVKFGEQAMRACEGRQFFATQGGRVGLAPSGTKELDRVCVLFGGYVPFILRPLAEEPGFFTLVGECIMPEIMFGEEMDGNEGRLGKGTLFHIR
jgi:hypothetical protein